MTVGGEHPPSADSEGTPVCPEPEPSAVPMEPPVFSAGFPGPPPLAGFPGPPPSAVALVPVEPAGAPVPPVPLGQPRWPVAAALLNLTGLSLGYWYVGARLRALLHLAATAGLVTTAFATDAASRPWLWRALAVVWVGWMAVDGWRLARRHPGSATAPRTGPGLVAAAAVLVVAAGYMLYGVASNRAFADGQAAQAAGDCAAATGRYDQVTGVYELTLSGNVAAATRHRAYCAAFVLAAAEHDSGRFEPAIARYHEYLTSTPDNSLDGFVHANLQRAYVEWGQSARTAKDYPTAIAAYRDLLDEYGDTEIAHQARTQLAQVYLDEAAAFRSRFDPAGGGTAAGSTPVDAVRGAMRDYLLVQKEFADTTPAAAVPQAIVETFTEAVRPFTSGKFCESLPVLDYLITLPPTESAGVVGTANDNRARASYECGVLRYRASSFDEANTLFEQVTSEYPNHALAASAHSALIATEIAIEGPATIPALPPALGDNSPGSISVTIYNDSSQETEVLLAGPTAYRIVLPACSACPSHYTNEADGCPTLASRPSLRLRLLAGEYHVLNRDTSGTNQPHLNTLSVLSGFTHTYCTFVLQDRI